MVNHEIVNLPSASTIAFQRQQLANRKPASKALAILADPVYSATDERVTGKPEKSQLDSSINAGILQADVAARQNPSPGVACSAEEVMGSGA
jgi:hypothetical protein